MVRLLSKSDFRQISSICLEILEKQEKYFCYCANFCYIHQVKTEQKNKQLSIQPKSMLRHDWGI